MEVGHLYDRYGLSKITKPKPLKRKKNSKFTSDNVNFIFSQFVKGYHQNEVADLQLQRQQKFKS